MKFNKFLSTVMVLLVVLSAVFNVLAEAELNGLGLIIVQPFNFNNTSQPLSDINNIIHGGTFAESSQHGFHATMYGIYIDNYDDDSMISNLVARNMTYISPYLYFTIDDEDNNTSSLIKMNVDDGTYDYQTLNLQYGSFNDLKQLYIVRQNNTNYIIYLSGDSTLRAAAITASGLKMQNSLSLSNEITGFIPTENGIICYAQDQNGYFKLFNKDTTYTAVDGIYTFSLNITDNCIDYYIDDTEYSTSFYQISNATGYVIPIKKEVEYIDADTLLDFDTDSQEYGFYSTNDNEGNSQFDPIDNLQTVSALEIMYKNAMKRTSRQTNIIKNARQIKEIRWNCLNTIEDYWESSDLEPRIYHGVPYHQAGNDISPKYLGFIPDSLSNYIVFDSNKISFEDFMSNVSQANSSYYSESGVWGADCSSFVSYSWGMDRETTSGLSKKAVEINDGYSIIYIKPIGKANIQYMLDKLHIGDIFVGNKSYNTQSNHTFLIASISRNSDNKVTQVVTWEQRMDTANNKRNVIVYSDEAVFSLETWEEYEACAVSGVALPLEALFERIKDKHYETYRLADGETVEYGYTRCVPLDGEYRNGDFTFAPLTQPTLNTLMALGNKLLLTWTASQGKANMNCSNAQKYEIYYSKTGNNNYKLIKTVSGFSCYVPKEEGYYKVRGYVDEAASDEYPVRVYSPFSDIKYFTYSVTAPQITNISYSNNEINIGWTEANGTTDIYSYRVYYKSVFSPDEFGWIVIEQSNTNLSTIISNLSSDQYYIRVCATYKDSDNVIRNGPFSYVMIGKNNRMSGDVDNDAEVMPADATMVLRYVANLATLSNADKKIADVDWNGTVDTADATAILKYVAMTDTLPPESCTSNWNEIFSYNPDSNTQGDSNTPILRAPRRNTDYQIGLITEEIGENKIRVTVKFDDYVNVFNTLQFRLNWNSELCTIANIESNIESITNYNCQDGWFILAYASAYDVEVEDRNIVSITFDVNNGVNIDELEFTIDNCIISK